MGKIRNLDGVDTKRFIYVKIHDNQPIQNIYQFNRSSGASNSSSNPAFEQNSQRNNLSNEATQPKEEKSAKEEQSEGARSLPEHHDKAYQNGKRELGISSTPKREGSQELKEKIILNSNGDNRNRIHVPGGSKLNNLIEPKSAESNQVSHVAKTVKISTKRLFDDVVEKKSAKDSKMDPQKISKKMRSDFRYQSDLALKSIISSMELVESDIASFVSFAEPEEENDKEKIIDDPETSIAALVTSPIVKSSDGEEEKSLISSVTLYYPGAKDLKEIFPLVIPKAKIDYSPLHDLYTSVQFIAQECLKDEAAGKLGSKKEGILRQIIKASHKKIPSDIFKYVALFNSTLLELQSANQVWVDTDPLNEPASPEFCKHILEQSYARTVAPKAHLLRNYEGFSNNVYGEITPLFVSEIIRNANIEPQSVFLDMGSGTGNVVLQVAAEVCCESYGIEIMDAPASLAKKQRTEFLGRMRLYGKPCGRIYLKQGDFLLDEGIHSVITKADVIFVNNYAFHADVNLQLLAKFLDVKPSCRIVTLRSFVSLRGSSSSGSGRFENSMETKFRVKEFMFPRNSVSWMPEGGSYYVHYVNQ